MMGASGFHDCCFFLACVMSSVSAAKALLTSSMANTIIVSV